MDSTSHFVAVTSESLLRLVTLVEQAAALLDQRGSRALRKKIIKETHFALGALRAVDNSVRGFGFGAVPPSALFDREMYRMADLKNGRAVRPTLCIVGGTDMKASSD
jgi:hypothetical protein